MKLYIFEKKDIKARGSSATERPGRRDPDDGAVWKASMLSFNPVLSKQLGNVHWLLQSHQA